MDEDELLRAVARDTAESIRQAKQRAEDDLLRTRDALERKTAELAASLAALRATLEATPDGILVIDADDRVVAANARFAGMWQVPPDVLASGDHRRVLDAVCAHVADPDEFRARVAAIAATAEPSTFDLLQLADDHVFERFSRVKVIDGRAAGRVWIFRDVTDRVRAESDLRLRNQAIETLSQGIVITDPGRPDNLIVYVSRGFERLTGYRSGEALGRNCRFLQGPDTDPAAVALVREAVRYGIPRTVELLNYRKDGRPFWNELSVSPVRDDRGAVVNFIAVQTDVTARRDLEAQLRQAQKMEAVGQLAGGVAHDFNNLLTVINGYADLVLADLPAGTAQAASLAAIRDAGQRAAALTAQLLAFSRKTIIEPRVLDLNGAVAGCAKMLARLVGEDVAVGTDLAPEPVRVRADPSQIEQVILNLAVNARDAMPDGGRLTIRTRAADVAGDPRYPALPPGRYAVLAVSDTGCGMPPEVQARIFEPFFTTKGVGKGTGLGLSTVYSIAQTYGGAVAVRSAVGAGATFEFLLPAARDGATPPASGERRPAPRGGEVVLVAEDDALVRGLTRTALRSLGYVVLDAGSGAEALRRAAEYPDPVHLLVTDVVMPEMSGRELAAELSKRHPGVRVLFVSGYTEDAVLRRGVREGADAFLQKPFTPHVLGLKVREVLDAPRPG